MTLLRAFFYGTTILAGLATLAESAPAYDLKRRAAPNGFHARALVDGPMLGGSSPQHSRKHFVAPHIVSARNRQKPVSRTPPPSFAGAHLNLKGSINLGQANPGQVIPGQAQRRLRPSRGFRPPHLVIPPMQIPAVNLDSTPAGTKIEALRHKLGLESIAAVQGAGAAPTGQAPAGGGSPSGGASGAAGLVNEGQGPGQPTGSTNSAADCIGEAGEGLPDPRGNVETGSGRHVPTPRINALMRDIAEDVGWAPALRPNSFHNDHGVWHGQSSEGHETDIVRGSSAITIIVRDRTTDRTTRYVYDRNPDGHVKLNHTDIEYGPDSSDPGMTDTSYPDTDPGHGNTITPNRPQDSQPVEGASTGGACGEAAIRHKREEAERRRNAVTRFRDPPPGGPSGVIVEPNDPPSQAELDDMTCQSGPDGDECRAHNGGGDRRGARRTSPSPQSVSKDR
jgi:hypothetical protein